jgi:hypothetical protein
MQFLLPLCLCLTTEMSMNQDKGVPWSETRSLSMKQAKRAKSVSEIRFDGREQVAERNDVA